MNFEPLAELGVGGALAVGILVLVFRFIEKRVTRGEEIIERQLDAERTQRDKDRELVSAKLDAIDAKFEHNSTRLTRVESLAYRNHDDLQRLQGGTPSFIATERTPTP